MQELVNAVSQLYKRWCGGEPAKVDVLPQSGSDRRYFRLFNHMGDSVIGTHGLNIPENETFIYFADSFKENGLPVPEVLAVSDDKTIYLQQDLGDVSLLNVLEQKGFVPEVYDLFKASLHQLARLQVLGDEGLNYDKCLTNKEFGKQAIMADLLYFKYYFLDALRKPYDKQKLMDDFEALSTYLTHTEYKYFMFRDFQSRNIMINEANNVWFIDFQGGMKGAPQYDVASMLWQARANLPDEWKIGLLEDYMDYFDAVIQNSIDRDVFRSQYNGYVLIRLLQVLGAYGFRGLFERKAQFLTSIPQALTNLKWFVENNSLGIMVPEFRKVLQLCIDDEVIQRFTPVQATGETPLVVKVCSFSYRKGIPEDSSLHGGGFVFDCRGIDNPGRHVEYKEIHGRDRPVMEYLERQTRMQDFLNSVFDIVDISVEEYIRRGFDSLSVNFGCTGGQHRSVYAADALSKHLHSKYKVKVELCHREQEAKGWINSPPAPQGGTSNAQPSLKQDANQMAASPAGGIGASATPPLGGGGAKAMIFAAGLGTRFKPWTDKHPKALAIINGKSLLQRNVEYLQQYGFTDVVVNVHHFADQVIEAIEKAKGWGSNIIISDEKDEVLETGGGLLKAEPFLQGERFLTINVDILTDVNLNAFLQFHQQEGATISLGVTNRTTSRYLLFNEYNRLCGWRNTATGQERIAMQADSYIQKAYSGLAVFEPSVFDRMTQSGKFSLIDVYLSIAPQVKIAGYEHSRSNVIDVGKPESVAMAESMFP